MKKTAMQQLIEKMENDIILGSNWREKFLEIEKQQIIDAANNGCRSLCSIDSPRDGENYYNQTFKTKDNG